MEENALLVYPNFFRALCGLSCVAIQMQCAWRINPNSLRFSPAMRPGFFAMNSGLSVVNLDFCWQNFWRQHGRWTGRQLVMFIHPDLTPFQIREDALAKNGAKNAS
jgi:hypothetical protein